MGPEQDILLVLVLWMEAIVWDVHRLHIKTVLLGFTC